MKKLYIALIIFGIVITAGMWGATQSFASMVDYHAALGDPLLITDQGTPIYWPYAYLVWYMNLKHIVPDLFDKTFPWLFLSFAGAVFVSAYYVKNLNEEEDSHGTAKWAEHKDIKKAGLLKDEGIVLGKSEKGKYLTHNGPEHVMVTAPPRSGKGVGVIIPSLFVWPDSAIVTDIKGENWGITAGYRQKHLNNKVIKLELCCTDGSSARFNPFDEIRIETEKEVADTQNIANIMMDPQGKGNLDHWGKSAQNLLVGAILHIKYVYREQASLGKLTEFLSDPDLGSILDVLHSMLETEHDAKKTGVFKHIYGAETYQHPIVLQVAQEMANKPEKELGSIVSSAMTALAIYRDPVLARNTSISDFCINDLMNHEKPVTLYMVIPPSDIDRVTTVFRLIVEIIVRRSTEKMDFKQGKLQKTNKYRMLLLLDEFPALGRMDTFERALAYIAGYGLKALLITQSLNQMNKIYTRENSVIDNCHVRVFFTPNDATTPEYIAKMLGKRTEVVTNKSSRIYEIFKDSRSTTNVARDLMTPGEVSLLKEDEELVFVAGCPPIKAHKVYYYKDKTFNGCVMDAPAKSDVINQTVQANSETIMTETIRIHQQQSRDREKETKSIEQDIPEATTEEGKDQAEEAEKEAAVTQERLFQQNRMTENEEREDMDLSENR